jgi:hypothetical protein
VKLGGSEPAFRLRVLPGLRYRAVAAHPGRSAIQESFLAEAGFRRLSGVDHLRRLAVTEGERELGISKPYIPDFCVHPGYWRHQINSGCSAPRIAEVHQN